MTIQTKIVWLSRYLDGLWFWNPLVFSVILTKVVTILIWIMPSVQLYFFICLFSIFLLFLLHRAPF